MLSEEQAAQFNDQGFLLVENVLDSAADLEPIEREYEALLDGLAERLFEDGRIKDRCKGLDFRDRLSAIYGETGETFAQYFNLSLPMTDVRVDTPFWTGPAIFNLIRNPRLLDLIESLIGPEVESNPIQHIRIKPPAAEIPDAMQASGLVGSTPWHQDAAVLPPDAKTELVTAWVPINDTPVETGCLQFIAGAHRDGLARHGFGPVDGLELPPEAFPDRQVLTVPARRGDVLLIHRHCPHSSLPNRSNKVRFSLDLRYHPSSQPSGREIFPSFTARSRSEPDRELTDPDAWTAMWTEARTWLATSPEAPKSSYQWLR